MSRLLQRASIRRFAGLCVVVLIGATAPARGQDCPGCVIGLYDDSLMTLTSGTSTGNTKAVYVGLVFPSGANMQFTAVEFSVAGLDSIRAQFVPFGSPAIVLGTPAAPAGWDSLYGQGGLNIAWAGCQTGTMLLGKLILTPRDLWPLQGTVLRVTRRYPPANHTMPFPLITRCDSPRYSPARLNGGAYGLGISGNPFCLLAAPSTDFGSVPAGDSFTLSFILRNTGEGLLSGAVQSDNPQFAIVDSTVTYALRRGQSREFHLRFRPLQNGVQHCRVTAGEGCSELDFVGRTGPIDIATLRANIGMFVGHRVQIEGQVFIPGDHAGAGTTSAWVQDGSGRGLNLRAVGSSPAALNDLHNRVRVSGTVRSFLPGLIVLEELTAPAVLESGLEPLVPTPVDLAALPDPALYGSYVEVSGFINSVSPDADPVNYSISNGSTAVVRVHRNLGVPLFEPGLWMTARGANEPSSTIEPGRAGDIGAVAVQAIIADLRTHSAAYLHRRVEIEGQVYLPLHPQPSPSGLAWVQDETGRGIAVRAPGFPAAALDDVHNRVHLSGVLLQEEPGALRFDLVAEPAIVASGLPELEPHTVPAAEIAGLQWTGSYVRLRGLIESRVEDGGQWEYRIGDGTGAVLVRTPGAAGVFDVGSTITVSGAADRDGGTWIQTRRSTDVVADSIFGCPGHALVVGAVQGVPGSHISVPLRVQWNPDPIDAWGLRIVFNGAVLRFVQMHCCDLTAGWQNCGASVVGRDTLIVGGFAADPVPANSFGVLSCLEFEVLRCGRTGVLKPLALTDDLEGLTACPGVVRCSACPNDGDVNRDLTLTPGDAQCAFEIYLAGQTVPPGCGPPDDCTVAAADVDCSAAVTPGDALRIFARWLSGDSAPEDCFGRTGVSRVARERGQFRLGVPQREGEFLAIPLEAKDAGSLAAFAFEWLPPADAPFESFTRTAGGERWNKLAARLTPEGRLRCGGYFASGLSSSSGVSGEWTTLGVLRLRTVAPAVSFDDAAWQERIVLDPVGTIMPVGPRWLAYSPNPVRAPGATFTVALPAAVSGAELRLLDVRGRLVQTLYAGPLAAGMRRFDWNGLDRNSRPAAAGVYIMQLRSPGREEQRKIIVTR